VSAAGDRQTARRRRDPAAGDVCTPDVLAELSSWAPEDWGFGPRRLNNRQKPFAAKAFKSLSRLLVLMPHCSDLDDYLKM
jgi:hypothetical protein